LERLAMENLGIFYDQLVYFTYGHCKYVMAIWYILWFFGIYFPLLVFWTDKNLATLVIGCRIGSRKCGILKSLD
jgi:hypothetical protein